VNDAAGLTLPSILAHARAGSLERAWSLFVAGGHDRNVDDPAALTLKGRLLKDRAALAQGDERQRLLGEAARAYARAAEIGGASYPLINAATLSLLAGDEGRAAEIAHSVLEHIRAHPDEPETPYYRGATQAEALLLLRRYADACDTLEKAIAVAPRAWEDHASTLRQFATILAAQGSDAGWLDPLRPARSLHFGGHMSFRADGDHAALQERIAAVLEAENIGFGFGALAAGADILIAEALLARDAELHLLLPGGIARFAALSVDPFGSEWRRRFDAALARAATIRAIDPVGTAPDQAMIDLADEVAMGAAIGNARRLASGAAQLLVLADDSASRSQDIWRAGDAARPQHVLVAPREPVSGASADAGSQRIAALAVRLAAVDPTSLLGAAKAVLDRAPAPSAAPCFTGDAILVGFDCVAVAAAVARELVGALGGAVSVGGHYGVGLLVRDPFSGARRVAGRVAALASAVASSTLAGSVSVTDDFAAAVEVWDPGARTEFIGELTEAGAAAPIGLHALRRAS
jgi:tetratricopeptide (TPR) repeat protein